MDTFLQILNIVTQLVIAFGVPILTIYIRKLEKNTNSMREQLVDTAGKLGIATGKEQEKERAKTEKEKPCQVEK